MSSVRLAAVAGVFVVSAVMAQQAEAGQTGFASYYKYGGRTASGERFNPNGLTAAHRTLPFGTRVLVTNLRNGRSVIVRVNDRGPFVRSRVIDLSYAAAKVVDLVSSGVASVKVVPLD